MRQITRLLLSLLLLAALCFAATTGRIAGTLKDPSGAVIPKATLAIINTATGIENNSSTDNKGFFAFPSLPVGNYNLTARFVGYVPLKKTVTVDNSVVTLGFSLQPQNTNLNEVVVVGYGTRKQSNNDLPKIEFEKIKVATNINVKFILK